MQSKETDLIHHILFTDFYELTMAQLYFLTGIHEKQAQFDYFFRHYPSYDSHQAGYCICAGMEWLVSWMKRSRFGEKETGLLRDLKGTAGKPLFHNSFLSWLREYGNFDGVSMQAVPEGRVVHLNVPLAVVRGGLAMTQILETALLNHLNYQTLVATKASRIYEAAGHNLTIDFGMRRAQGEGANAGSRAALIGGVNFSSNTGLSCSLGLDPKGTHAHSMIQAFMSMGSGELEAFNTYADIYPDDCVLLVDTIDTLNSGIPNAIKVFESLKKRGHTPIGIRLDSGDLAHLSIQAAIMLDKAGFPDVRIVLSNQLDEMVIWQIVSQIREQAGQNGTDADRIIGRLAYGVGTSLLTSKGAAALDGIYKLTAVHHDGSWRPAIKITESVEKISNPGDKDVFRIYDTRGKATADVLFLADETIVPDNTLVLHHPYEHSTSRILRKEDISKTKRLLVQVFKDGKLVYDLPPLDSIRTTRQRDLELLDPGVKRLINPHVYHVSLTEKLWKLKQKLVAIHYSKKRLHKGNTSKKKRNRQ